LKSGDPLRVEIDYVSPQPVQAPIFGVTISREDGLICCDTSTSAAGLILPTIHGRGQIALHLERLDLEVGSTMSMSVSMRRVGRMPMIITGTSIRC
jgi:lipopolysaccharide transport system ATP-binding protein